MKSRAALLACSLASAMITSIVGGFADRAGAAPARRDAMLSPAFSVILTGGQDSVGSLLSLPLLPSPRFQSWGGRTAKWWKARGRACCYATRLSDKARR
jgi:hypothetical protein